MSVLVYVNHQEGKFNKKSYEVVTYGRKTADLLGEECVALTIGADQPAKLGSYGASKVLAVESDHLSNFDSQNYASAIIQVAEQQDAKTVIIQHSANGKSLLGRISVKWEAGSVSGVNQLPETEDGFHLIKPVFSGKAFARYQIKTEKRVLSLMGNSIAPEEIGEESEVETVNVDVEAPKTEVVEVDRVKGEVPLTEAELVVSAGRGMKDPDNWDIIEELADALGASTACSRPVADSGWRPHHEHVGQTGIAIRPNLYLAVGISGAIQHLAGVNNSKTIVVVNKDPEAPFFKAADYGVCADLFDVVPRLTEAVKSFNKDQ